MSVLALRHRFRLDSPAGLLLLFLLLVLAASLLSPDFLTVDNMTAAVRQMAVVGIVAVGMTLVLIAGEIDLSVGSVAALSAVVGAVAMDAGAGGGTVIAVTLATGLASGLVNAIGITLVGVPSLIMTLGTLSIGRALASIVSGGRSSYPSDLDAYMFLGRGDLLGLPMSIVVFVLVVAVAIAVFRLTALGRMFYLIGGNATAAGFSGVSERLVKLIGFVAAGFCAALAGLIQSARLGEINPSMGQGFELTAIAVAILGGASLFGGRGSMEGTFVAALIFGVIYNLLNLLGFSGYVQQIFVACVIVAVASMHAIKGKQ